jgi:hypothetical protein
MDLPTACKNSVHELRNREKMRVLDSRMKLRELDEAISFWETSQL